MLQYSKFIGFCVFLCNTIWIRLSDELINLSYNVLYVYSKLQIYINKLNRYVNFTIDNNEFLFTIKNELLDLLYGPKKYIEYIKDGISSDVALNSYDFIIYNNYKNTDVHKKLIYGEIKNLDNYEISNVNFMLIELKIGDKNNYNIYLKTEKYNFYIVGNKLTREFFYYYLKTILSLTNIDSNDNIKLKIIDHNVNKLEFEFTKNGDAILLAKNDYKIIKNDMDN